MANTRREVLYTAASLAGGSVLAGCATSDRNTSTETQTTADTTQTQTTTTTTAQEAVSSDDYRFEVQVQSQSSPDSPAQIQTTFTNTAGSSLTFIGGPSPPFSTDLIKQSAGKGEVLLFPTTQKSVGRQGTDEPLQQEREHGCWDIEEELAISMVGSEVTLKPGDELREEFLVFDRTSAEDRCFLPGEYPAENHVHIRGEGYSTTEVVLSFTLSVEADSRISIV